MSIMVRAEITDSEWKELRKLAVDLEMPIQRMIAEALRVSRITERAFAAATKEDEA